MECSKCKHEAVVYQPYSGQHLCREHLILDIEAKARRVIRSHRMIRPSDHIGVVLTGADADCALLAFLQKLAGKRRDVLVTAIHSADLSMDLTVRARSTGVTRLASAATLEDTAAAVLADVLRGNAVKIRLGSRDSRDGLPVIAPFCHIPAAEIAVYSRIMELAGNQSPSRGNDDPLLDEVKALLADYTLRHPAAPHAVLNLAESLADACSNGAVPDAT